MPRLAVIDNEKIKHMEDKLHIQSLCPVNRTGADCMYFENDNLLIDEILCTGCGICVKAAPSESIKVINLPDESSKPIVHQYGKNGFRIFDLPLLQEGSITGIIGINGIGKSTVINVLSNIIKANFAKFGEESIKEEDYFTYLNEQYKGTALQNFFNKLEKGDIKVAYKPQQIIDIPKLFKGNVRELLEKVNSNKKTIENLTKELGITQILDRDIKVISGGELQRVALAAALLKKDTCNLFIFDEITNYLDIFQRLNSSKLIKHQTANKTSLVVEHDLVVLDYLCDFVHLMYGEQGAYGMLTGVKAAKTGINTYLEGYSKDENVRFRDKTISFDKESVTESKKILTCAKWEKSEIKRGEFKLEFEEGDIKVGEILGIIGENGLGKSTFISHIAKEGIGEDKFVSYKEQLIERSDQLVMHELMQFENFTDNFYDIYVLGPLNIKKILEKPINTLSGGELQRFAVAKCLLQNADIYLLDEPTAFLDIEERLKLAKIIKNFIMLKAKSAFIIDHDLVFMDYLSDRLFVFTGEPSVQGLAHSPQSMRDGMNLFLKRMGITFRRDDANKRPRVNKENSVKDQEQKKRGEYYYV